jgi:hypothetical protein
MRRIIVVIGAAALVLSIAGCSSAVPIKDAGLSFGSEIPAHPIIGEKVTLTGTVDLAGHRTDAVTVRLQERNGNDAWKTFVVKGSYKLTRTGTTWYRITVSEGSQLLKELGSTSPTLTHRG